MATQYVWTAVSCVLAFWLLYGDSRDRGVQLAVKKSAGPRGSTP